MNSKPRLLDLFCGAGGAGAGYARAGFEVVGVDIADQPNYPFEFIRADALDVLADYGRPCSIDAIHASPPCQAHVKGLRAVNRQLGVTDEHVDLIPATRELLIATGLPYVIENVVGAPLLEPVRLCGTSFGLPLRRHRLFESSAFLFGAECRHDLFTEQRYWNGDRSKRNGDGTRSYEGTHRRSTVVQIYGNAGEKREWPAAMGIDWMEYEELAEAIPPAYTEFIGEQLLAQIGVPA